MNRLLYLIWYRLGPSVLHACLRIFEYIVLSSQEINGDGIKTKHSYQYPLFKIESLVDRFLKLPLQNFVYQSVHWWWLGCPHDKGLQHTRFVPIEVRTYGR
jgi:hypothetical protein